MTARYQQRVPGRDGIGIPNRQDEFIFGDDPLARKGAEYTAVVTQCVSSMRGMEIRRVPIKLLRIADAAQRLKIAQVIRSAFGAGDNMVDLKRSLLVAYAARLASSVRAPEHFISESARDGIEILRAMAPDRI